MLRALALLLLSLAALAGPAAAQDVPGRVGRLAWFDGRVSLYQDPDRGWEEAYPNSPVTSRNSVWTDRDSRAEVRVGPIALRMDSDSQLDVSRIDDDTLDAMLEQGTMAIRVRHLRPRHVVRVSTPQASFLLDAEGRYRLDADPDRGETRLTVFDGAAGMETGNGAIRIAAGDSVVVWGADHPDYALQAAYDSEFDRWAMSRDEHWIERRATEYVSYEMTGYEDLDAYGEWSQDPTYGVVWYPNGVSADWAPYRYGRWTYVSPWGWTWVDEAPWGYAPFHYGRWVRLEDRWAWCPGRRVDQPAWAPALVGFIGGSGWNAGGSAGATVVGWYPLAPSETYRPWYRANTTYVKQVNASVIRVPDNVARQHREWNRDHAATVVRRDALVAQRPVQQARVTVAPQALRAAPAIAAPANALPSRNDVREAHRREGAKAPAPPAQRGEARQGNAAARAAPATASAKPSYAKPRVAPRPAPKDATPPAPNAIARKSGVPPAPAAARPGAPREAARPQAPARAAAREAGPERARAAQDRAKAEQERAKAESRVKDEQERAKSAQDERQRADAQRKAQQDAAQEAQRKAADQARQKASREAEQSRAQAASRAQEEKAAQEAQRQRADAERKAQQGAAQEAQRKAAEEARQKSAREAEQSRAQAAQQAQQQKAARDAEQGRARAAQEAQQRAAQQAQQHAQEAQQRAAQQAQHAQEAQQRAAQEAQKRAAQQAQEAQHKGAARRPPPEEQKDPEKEKDKGRGEGH